VEAQACGTPVIAYGKGGSLETVKGVFPGMKVDKDKTGIFFREQTVESLIEAIDWFERSDTKIDPAVCRQNAERFSRDRFQKEFKEFVEARWAEFNEKTHSVRLAHRKG
jgi:glycosyltransferase involved in cell wall biosynthesis